MTRALVLGVFLIAAEGAFAHGEEPAKTLFEPPAVGSYELPPIQAVREHELLAPDGSPAPLLALEEGQVALVNFVYTRCTDATGCPLSLAVVQRVDRLLAERPDLGRRTRLVTVSFDPARDTPAEMGKLARHMRPRGDWRFLTPRGDASTRALLRDFGQDTRRLPDERIAHVLKVFLVDSKLRVRNVYSSGFLDTRILLNDLATVLSDG